MKLWIIGPAFAVVLASVVPHLSAQPSAPHPAMGGMPPGHGNQMQGDSSQLDSSLPAGTVIAQILDARGEALPNTSVKLLARHNTVAEGVSEKEETANSDGQGVVRFSGLPTGTGYTFSVSVDQPPARYESPLFGLGGKAGHRVQLHVFPASHSLDDALVAERSLFHIEPRDDVFQVSVLLELFNLGETTWVPRDVGFRLPNGWKAFNPQSNEGTVTVAAGDTGINLKGSVNPGRHTVTFGFQIPRDGSSTAAISIGLPPRMQSINVRLESSPQMRLTVPGFPEAQPAFNREQVRLLMTQRELQPGETAKLDRLDIQIAGLPDRGNGRWISLLLALGTAAAGIWVASQTRGSSGVDLPQRDAVQARELLFAELVSVEKAYRNHLIGPDTRGQARETLIGALARLQEMPSDENWAKASG